MNIRGASLNNETADPELAALELEKLKLEVAALGKPIWKQSSFYTALFPIIVAVLTVGTGYYTGYFNTVKERNAYESEKIADQNNLLEAKKNKLDGDIKQYTESNTELRDQNQELKRDRDRLDQTIKEKTTELQSRIDVLNKEVDDLSLEKKRLTSNLAELNEELKDPEFFLLADQLSSQQIANNEAFVKLSVFLKKDPKTYLALIERASRAPDPVKRGMLLLLRYLTLNDLQARKELFAMFSTVPADVNPKFWDIFVYPEWKDDDIPQILELLVARNTVGDLNVSSIADLLGLYGLRSHRINGPEGKRTNDFIINSFKDRNVFFSGFKLAAKYARDSGSYYRQNGLDALAWFEPRAYFVFCAEFLTDNELDERFRSQIRTSLSDRRETGLVNIIKSVHFPEDEAQYSNWLSDNKDLASFWLDPNLRACNTGLPKPGPVGSQMRCQRLI